LIDNKLTQHLSLKASSIDNCKNVKIIQSIQDPNGPTLKNKQIQTKTTKVVTLSEQALWISVYTSNLSNFSNAQTK
jgi:hypothetical protein